VLSHLVFTSEEKLDIIMSMVIVMNLLVTGVCGYSLLDRNLFYMPFFVSKDL